MNIFNNSAFVSAAAARDYSTVMNKTHPKHMGPIDSPYFGSGNRIIALQERIGGQDVTRAGSFQTVMLQALDKVSGAQQHASDLQQLAIIDPDSIDIHDVTIAQAQANMSLGIARNILSRLVQGWRDIINTR
jgi:flagellar hook-basal body complex protein FliE